MLKRLIEERLMAAADEIFAQFERTTASYEEQLSRTREEKERYRKQLEAVASKTGIILQTPDIQQLIGRQEMRLPIVTEGSFTLKQEEPPSSHIKEEEEELHITQEGVCLLGPEEAHLTEVKTENNEEQPQANNLLAPLSDSDDIKSHSPEDEDRFDTQKPSSSVTDCEVFFSFKRALKQVDAGKSAGPDKRGVACGPAAQRGVPGLASKTATGAWMAQVDLVI
ncbi:uncharacterized protein LOC133554507 isoform X3 [Nerophis ophidion]|uniref:uncharacterized protein LOC133554507 isoform X3 n=1 Tax=Nerophis ophidion TaxID=159077 RepID=UPI002ADF8713|nr:uncharacterized protein LOC133554507 isoform X3 [Nerophis ophidion]